MAKTSPENRKPNSLGHRIMVLRRARSLTQGELAEAVGTSQRVISYYENDSHDPGASMLSKLAQAFGVTIDMLLADSEPHHILASRDTALARRFVDAENLPPADRKALVRIIDALLATNNRAGS